MPTIEIKRSKNVLASPGAGMTGHSCRLVLVEHPVAPKRIAYVRMGSSHYDIYAQTILEQAYNNGVPSKEWRLVVNMQPMYDGTETFYDITDSFKMEIQL